MTKKENEAIHTYEEIIKAVYMPEKDFMLSTEQWIFHALNNFYVTKCDEHGLEAYDSLIRRTIANHDLDWLEVIRLPEHEIKVYIGKDRHDANKVDIIFSLIENKEQTNYNHDENEIVIKEDKFFYYAAGPLIYVTKELKELEDSYGDCKSLKAYQVEENELIEKQLSEQNWNGKGGKN